MTASPVRRPAVLTHTFWTTQSAAGLATAWDAALAAGIDRPIDGLPEGLSDPGPAGAELRVLGARSGGELPQLHQALAYRLHDVLGLAVLRAPNDDTSWAALVPAGPPPADAIGGAVVHLGVLPGTDGPAGAGEAALTAGRLRPLLPGPVDGGWEGLACGFRSGITVWELPANAAGSPPVRRLLVVAPEAREEALDRWTWSDDGPELPPLTRYLLQAARLRYQRDVLLRDRAGLDRLLDDSDTAAGTLVTTLRDDRTRLDDLVRRSRHLTEVQTRQARLMGVLTRTRSMTTTVRIAERNLTAELDQPRFAAAGGGLLASDRRIAEDTAEQLRAEETYLQAEVDRVAPLLAAARTVVDESIRERVDGRVLVQTSLVGGLLAVLAAVQSLEYEVAMPRSLQAPLIALIGALVLWLPSGVLHWRPGERVPRGWRRMDVILLTVLGAAAGWAATATTTRYATGHPAPPWASLAGAAGAAVTLILIRSLMNRIRARRNRRAR